MSDILRRIQEDAVFLKEHVVGARAAGVLTTSQAQQAITACARLIQIIKESSPGGVAHGLDGNQTVGPLSEFFRWPSQATPCPKCGATKPRFLDYMRESKLGEERMKHVCRCGYCIYTKPLDQSPTADTWAAAEDDFG